jgi:hypothetical protein
VGRASGTGALRAADVVGQHRHAGVRRWHLKPGAGAW